MSELLLNRNNYTIRVRSAQNENSNFQTFIPNTTAININNNKVQQINIKDPTPMELVEKAISGAVLTADEIDIVCKEPKAALLFVQEVIKRPLNTSYSSNPLLITEKKLLRSIISASDISYKYIQTVLKRPLDLNNIDEVKIFESIATNDFTLCIYIKYFLKRPLNLKFDDDKRIFTKLLNFDHAGAYYATEVLGRPLNLNNPIEDKLLNKICLNYGSAESYISTLISNANILKGDIINGTPVNMIENDLFEDFLEDYENKYLLPKLISHKITSTIDKDGTIHISMKPNETLDPKIVMQCVQDANDYFQTLDYNKTANFTQRWHNPNCRIPDKIFIFSKLKWLPFVKSDYKCTNGINVVELCTSDDLKFEGIQLSHCVGTGGYAAECASSREGQGVMHIISFRDENNIPSSTAEIHLVPKGEGININNGYDIKIVQHTAYINGDPSPRDVDALNEWVKSLQSNVTKTVKVKFEDLTTKLGPVEHPDAKKIKVKFSNGFDPYLQESILTDFQYIPTEKNVLEVKNEIAQRWRLITEPTSERYFQKTSDGNWIEGISTKQKDSKGANIYKWYNVNGPKNIIDVTESYDPKNIVETRKVIETGLDIFAHGQFKEVTVKVASGAAGANSKKFTIANDDNGEVIEKKLISFDQNTLELPHKYIPKSTISVPKASNASKVQPSNSAAQLSFPKLILRADLQRKISEKFYGERVTLTFENGRYKLQFPNNTTGTLMGSNNTVQVLEDVLRPLGIQPNMVQQVPGQNNLTFTIPEIGLAANDGDTQFNTAIYNDRTEAISRALAELGFNNVTVIQRGANNNSYIEVHTPNNPELAANIQITLTTKGVNSTVHSASYQNNTTSSLSANIAGAFLKIEQNDAIVIENSQNALETERKKLEIEQQLIDEELKRQKENAAKNTASYKKIKVIANSAYGRATNQGQAVISFAKMIQAANNGDLTASYNNMVNGISSELLATLKYWAPALARYIGKELLENIVKSAIPFTGAAFGVNEICNVCLSEDPNLKKKCAMTIVSNIIEVLPSFIPVLGPILKFTATPDLISILVNKLVGVFSSDYRAPNRSVESILIGTNDVLQGNYNPTPIQPARSKY